MSDFETLVGRALADEQFAAALVEGPEATLRQAGIEPTDKMIEALNGIDVEAVKNLATVFGQHKAAR